MSLKNDILSSQRSRIFLISRTQTTSLAMTDPPFSEYSDFCVFMHFPRSYLDLGRLSTVAGDQSYDGCME